METTVSLKTHAKLTLFSHEKLSNCVIMNSSTEIHEGGKNQ